MALMMEPAGIITENRALLGHDANNLQRDWIKCQARPSQATQTQRADLSDGPLRTQATARHLPSSMFPIVGKIQTNRSNNAATKIENKKTKNTKHRKKNYNKIQSNFLTRLAQL